MRTLSRIPTAIILLTILCHQTLAQDDLRSALRRYDYVQAVCIIDSMMLKASPDSATAMANKSELINLALQKANCLKKLRQPDKAAEALSEVLPYDQFNVELLAELAECKTSVGDLESAMFFYSILGQSQRDNLYFKLCETRVLYQMKAYKDVIASCEDISRTNVIPDVLLMAGDSYNILGQKDSAIAYYDRLLATNPYNAKIINRKANILMSTKEYDRILRMTRDYLKECPDDLDILPVQGVAEHLKGEFVTSAESFQRMLELGDDSYPVHYYLGMNHYALKRWPKAIKELETAYKVDSSDVKLAYKLADSYGHLSGAEADSLSEAYFKKALDMTKPDSAVVSDIYGLMGRKRLMSENFREAIEFYKLSYGYGVTNISALSSIGYCYERLKDFKKAAEYYKRYLKLGKPGSSGHNYVKESLEYVRQELFMLEGADQTGAKK